MTNTNSKNRKMKMNVRGAFHQLWTRFVLKRRMKSLGLNIHEINYRSLHQTEIIVSGETEMLWKALDSAKTPSFLLKMDKIVFEFID